jgi:hypothetical protein
MYLLVFTHILLGILIFKGFTARRIYKSFGVKGFILLPFRTTGMREQLEGYIHNYTVVWMEVPRGQRRVL